MPIQSVATLTSSRLVPGRLQFRLLDVQRQDTVHHGRHQGHAVKGGGGNNHGEETKLLPEFSLHGKVAVVTGGARGLGREMMRALARVGADVVAVDLLEQQARESSEQVGAECGVRAAAWGVDVTDELQVTTTFAAIEREFGPIDVLVAAAGIVENVAAEDYPAASWRKMI